ncbi:MAG: hypothetical protein M0R03_10685 [Novosphingobium sp.]|nr:hypothetical protein [Novosphingobium sp.]
MKDRFSNHSPGLEAPGSSLFAITPADSDLPALVRALYVGTGGDLVLLAKDDSDPVTLADVPSGSFIPVRAKRVMAATTASGIVGIV